jgi:hypothetical protein
VRTQGRAVIVAVSLVALALFFLPSLLSFQPVFSAVLDLASKQLSGNLEAASCSVGWVRGFRCEQVRYHDSVSGVHFEAPQGASDKGLLLLMAAPSYLGEITIDQPTLSFLPPQPGHDLAHTENKAAAKVEATTGVPDREGREKTPWWERLSFRLRMNSGQLVFDHGAKPGRQLARKVDLTGSLAMGTLHYDLQFLSAQQSGHLRAKGFINLPLAGQSFLETLISRAEVEINDLEIADFLELAASRSRAPRGKGVLNATLHLKAAGIEDFEVQGENGLRGLQLTGGVLGQDQLLLDQLRFTFKGSHRPGEGWRLADLELQSEPVQLRADGSFDGKTISLAAKGSVNLPVMMAQVPHLLGLHEKTTVTEGRADFSLGVTGGAEAFAIEAVCRTDRLSLVHDGQPYSWSTPLIVEAVGDYGGATTGFRTLRAHTPFFEVTGSGGFDDFTLQGGGDLDRMSQELKKIFSLDVHAKGQVALSAATRKREEGGFRLESRVSIQDFALTRGKRPLFPAHDFLLTSKATAAASFLGDGVLHALQVDAVSWPGNVSLLAEDLARDREQTQNNYTLKGAVDLERLSTIVHGFRDDASAPVLKGKLQFDGAGEYAGARIAVRSMNGMIEQLVVAGAGYVFQEPRVVFGMGGAGRLDGRRFAVRELMVADNWQDLSDQEHPVFWVDVARRRLEMRRLGWTSAKTVLETDLMLEDWRQPAAGFSAALRGESDGALLADLAKAAGWLPSDLTVKGRAGGTLAIDSAPGQGERTELTLRMEPFEVARSKKKLFADPRAILKISLLDEGKGDGELKVPFFFLQTIPFRIEGAGLVATRNKTSFLELQGQVTHDFVALAQLLAPVIGRQVVASGNRSGEFLLSLPLSLPLKREQVTFTVQLPLESLRFQGIGLRQLTLPVDVNRGKLRLSIDGQLDGGRATLEPSWNLDAHQPVVTLPPVTQLLKDVPLKPLLVDGLLSRLHPLFGVVAQPQGVVDLRVDSFSAPVSEKGPQRPVFTIAVALDRIKFKPTGGLREMLDLDGYDQAWLRCKEREVICEGKDGRVSCGPVHLLAGEAEFGLRGAMHPDGSLQYQVRLPVSKQLADKAQLVVHADVTVEAEIGGTRDKPVFDSAAFLVGLSAQLRKGVELTEHQAEEGPAVPSSELEKSSLTEALPE